MPTPFLWLELLPSVETASVIMSHLTRHKPLLEVDVECRDIFVLALARNRSYACMMFCRRSLTPVPIKMMRLSSIEKKHPWLIHPRALFNNIWWVDGYMTPTILSWLTSG
jgi:hypothetical protein